MREGRNLSMADKLSHIAQWKHNRLFIASIDGHFHDWIVTAVFYTALHSIDTLLSHDKISVTDHDARKRALLQTNRYEFINKKFLPLYGLSRSIRYLANPSKWVSADAIQKEVIERYLYPIENSVQKLIDQKLELGPVILKPQVTNNK